MIKKDDCGVFKELFGKVDFLAGCHYQSKRELLYTFAIKGVTFNNRQLNVELVKPKDYLEMRREPENPHDPKAVALYFNGKKLGYIPKEIAPSIVALLDQKANLFAVVSHIREMRTSTGIIKVPIVDIIKDENSFSNNNEQNRLIFQPSHSED